MKRFTKKILILLNLAAALALGLSYLSNYISPGKAWIFSFFGLTYPLFILLNVFFMFFWLLRRNKLALISLIVILLGISFIGRYLQVRYSFKPEYLQGDIKVISYNVRLFNYFEWEHRGSVRDTILNYFKDESAEIICIQDFFTRKDNEKLGEKYIRQKLTLTPFSHIEYTCSFSGGNSNFGIAIFSKYPIIKRGSINFENSVNGCIYSDIVIKKDTVRVYNVHLQSNRLQNQNYEVMDSIFHISSKKIGEVKDISKRLRKASIVRSQQVDLVVKHLKECPYPVILCGDFNDTPMSYAYQKLLDRKKDAYCESGSGIGNTYRGTLPSYRIDYIMYSNDFLSENYKTKRIKLSDHFPVSCSLKLIKD